MGEDEIIKYRQEAEEVEIIHDDEAAVAEHHPLAIAFHKFRADFEAISKAKTPPEYIKDMPGSAFKYVPEGDMRRLLNKHFPVWEWHEGKFEFLGAEWIACSGELTITLDNGMKKTYYSTGAARIQYASGKDHVPRNIIDIDKNIAAANSNAFKRAINRVANIADDVYHKMDSVLGVEVVADLKKKIAQVEDKNKKELWMHKLATKSIDYYNLDEFQRKIEAELKEDDDDMTLQDLIQKTEGGD